MYERTKEEHPRAPRGLSDRAKELWRKTVREYELTDSELVILAEACRVLHTIDQLQEIVDVEGLMASSSQGVRTHPAVVEQRQARLLLARLFRTLALPVDGAGQDEQPGALRVVRGA